MSRGGITQRQMCRDRIRWTWILVTTNIPLDCFCIPFWSLWGSRPLDDNRNIHGGVTVHTFRACDENMSAHGIARLSFYIIRPVCKIRCHVLDTIFCTSPALLGYFENALGSYVFASPFSDSSTFEIHPCIETLNSSNLGLLPASLDWGPYEGLVWIILRPRNKNS